MTTTPPKALPVPQPSLFSLISQRKLQAHLSKEVINKAQRVQALEKLLQEHGIEIPEEHQQQQASALTAAINPASANVFVEGSTEELAQAIEREKPYLRNHDFAVEFYNLTMTTMVPIGYHFFSLTTIIKGFFCFWNLFLQKKKELHVVSDLTGRILPRKMTLLLGPPGSGKSVLLKALAGRLRPLGGAKISGDIYYDGDNVQSKKFLVEKVSDYIEQGDTHSAVLTVEETMKFAWLCTTGGHHSYGRAKDEASVAILNQEDPTNTRVQNILTVLGLKECKDMYVGDQMTRGVSGGQKRRVTVGEMVIIPRPVKFMDCISNGLDTATAFDIIQALSIYNHASGFTFLISLLQPPPDVYHLFDEIILLCEGQIIYQGSRENILPYFATLGYICPSRMDEADFLQELPTAAGRRFVKQRPRIIPHALPALSTAWKSSKLYAAMLSEMKYASNEDARHSSNANPKEWHPDEKTKFASSNSFFYFKLNLQRQTRILLRDETFIKARIIQSLVVGGIAGSLFSNIAVEDTQVLNGFLFNSLLFTALGSFALLPMLYNQKAVFYKMKDSLFFPTWTFTIAQTVSLIPLQIFECMLYAAIVYWSAGLSSEYNGSRFLTFVIVTFMFSLTISQLFRFIAAIIPSPSAALPVAGIDLVIMILFSGFIEPRPFISNGWIWFYYMNPIAWGLKSITLNEFLSSKYNFQTCVNYPTCTSTRRYGDVILDQYGILENHKYIWYSFAVLIAEYIGLLIVTTIAMDILHFEKAPAFPHRTDDPSTSASSMEAIWKNIENDDKEKVLREDGKNQNYEELRVIELTSVKDTQSEYIYNESNSSSSKKMKRSSSTHSRADVELGYPVSVKVSERSIEELEFDQVNLAFVDIWYTVTLSSGDDIDLLKGVNGFFEPGTMVALMGASGAGKTTLLDVLAGRKNTGVVKGTIYINGLPKVEGYFRQIMGYVEQFDSLPQKSTAREAIAFSAALRLPSTVTDEQCEKWVNTILYMLDLESIEDELVGSMDQGGMTFEQRKRVSIGVELAANPSILFLDEPTTGLDSLAAQSLIGNIRKIAASGRSIVCTIHQPSSTIFNAFDSLLLLKRGGQTVFFGTLGDNSINLTDFFEAAPEVVPMPVNTNPATWMLDIIGAGTSTNSVSTIDYHAYYKQSALCEVNQLHLRELTTSNEGSRRLEEHEMDKEEPFQYNASSWKQFKLLLNRIGLTYWRTPTYSFGRSFVNLLIALIFGSAFPQQVYDTYVAVVSRAGVIYITSLFCGVIAMLLVQPVFTAERPVFYREQQSRMYAVWIYTASLVIIEIPYIIIAALAFALPFFYIVGFDYLGNTTQRFFYLFFFNVLLQGAMLFLGELFSALTPTEQTAQVVSGLFNTLNGLFCGFLIPEQSFPTFWLFMYWLNPLHYALEGMIMSQFKEDTTPVHTFTDETVTAYQYLTEYQFTTWRYGQIGYDVLALSIFLFVAIVAMYLCLAYLRHDRR